MNHNPANVKRGVAIQERESGKLSFMKVGRASDEALAWYCHKRITELLQSGVSQKEIAKRSGLPPSAINHLLKNGKGVGSLTAAAFTELFGFKTRGALIDAADTWLAGEGKHYALHEQRRQSRERERKLTASVEGTTKSLNGARSKKKTA